MANLIVFPRVERAHFPLDNTIIKTTNSVISIEHMKKSPLTADLPKVRKMRKYLVGGKFPDDPDHT